ncbi:MAG: hypothetical protein RL172_2842 [Bacteroidota bacterium]|jgi:metallo-beta-lactamase class B
MDKHNHIINKKMEAIMYQTIIKPYFFYLAFSFVQVLMTMGQCQAQTLEDLAKNPALFLQVATKSQAWNEPAEPARVVGNIYSVGTRGLTAWLITSPQGHILVNTGMPASGQLIETAIRKLGFKPEDIKYLLTCHAHIDHVGGHAYLQKLSGAKVVLMAAEKELIESGGKTDYFYINQPSFLYEPVKVDWAITDGAVVQLDSIAIKALHTPGHGQGSTTWITEVVENGKRYQVVFPDGSGINPGFHVTAPESYKGMGDNYRQTLQKLEMLKPDIWLTSHAASMKFEEKLKRAATEGVIAWVDPAGYRLYIASEREKFDAEVKLEKGIKPVAPAPQQ